MWGLVSTQHSLWGRAGSHGGFHVGEGRDLSLVLIRSFWLYVENGLQGARAEEGGGR